jgi:hypothetical protein
MSEPTEPTVIIRYPNLSGAIVHVTRRIEASYEIRTCYDAVCTACLDEDLSCFGMSAARKWAAGHSATCRALPQPEPTGKQQGESL